MKDKLTVVPQRATPLDIFTLIVTVSPFAPLALVAEYVTFAAFTGNTNIEISIINAVITAKILDIRFILSPLIQYI